MAFRIPRGRRRAVSLSRRLHSGVVQSPTIQTREILAIDFAMLVILLVVEKLQPCYVESGKGLLARARIRAFIDTHSSLTMGCWHELVSAASTQDCGHGF